MKAEGMTTSESIQRVYDALVDIPLAHQFFETIKLPRMALHWPYLVGSIVACRVLLRAFQIVLPIILPKSWKRASKADRLKQCVRHVSSIHAVYVVTQALVVIANLQLRANPVYGTDPVAESAFAVSLGYFIWDACTTYKHLDIFGTEFLFHSIFAFGVYVVAFLPLLQYYGACFLMFEVSTLFLNLHYFFEDIGWKEAVIYFINGTALVSSFFFSRIVFGTMLSINVWKYLSLPDLAVSGWIVNYVRLADLLLMGLSYYWFSQIILSAKRTVLDADLIRALEDRDKKD